MDKSYKGAKWYKCDFHLHSTASQCFKDRTVTPEQWVDAAIEAGLNCVALTDHNTGRGIDEIKAIAYKKGLIVFPGVELTCDTSKIHLLIIFDREKTSQDIEDFILLCGINREQFAKSDAHSEKNIFDIMDLAVKRGGLIIPAHIDEYNGLGYCASFDSVRKFLDSPSISAVQFVHKEFLQPDLKIKDNPEIVEIINKYYGNPSMPIGADHIKAAYDSIKEAIAKKKCLLTFSDNPDSMNPSKHGLSGIGKCYTWIKMDEEPSIESIRQALLLPGRAINCFDSPHPPYKEPSLWIKRIVIKNTLLTRKETEFSLDFNPQLTTIIGGRGSGKSSILRFIRGVFNNDNDLAGLEEIFDDFRKFFKISDNEGLGVLKPTSIVYVFFVRDGIDYRITYNQSSNPRTLIEKIDPVTSEYSSVTDAGFIDFFQFEQYSQKQIFSIAQKPNSLRNRIDSQIEAVGRLSDSLTQLKAKYLELTAGKRAIQSALQVKGKLETEIKDLELKILLLKKSGISELISKQQSYSTQVNEIQTYLKARTILPDILRQAKDAFNQVSGIDFSVIDKTYTDEIQSIYDIEKAKLQKIENDISSHIEYLSKGLSETEESFMKSSLFNDYLKSKETFSIKRDELESKGITDMSDFERYEKQIAEKRTELADLLKKEVELKSTEEQIELIGSQIKDLRYKISEERQKYLDDNINSDKINITIIPFGDQADFETKFRYIIQRKDRFENSIEALVNYAFSNKREVMKSIVAFRKIIWEIYEDKYFGDLIDGRFSNLLKGLPPSSLDEFDLLYPEDHVEVKYKGRDGKFKSLEVASAGQKTTAILSFILSAGTVPLILDQPEDDLDNRLVYDLIVDKIRQIKEHRQVIIVTHNANIPVNGDAEYIVSLASDTRNLKIQAEGTVEKIAVKKEICEVMEGGVEAFKIRAKRYESL